MSAILEKQSLRDFDWLLAILAIGIVCFGTIQIRYAQPHEAYWVKQLIGLGIALVAMIAGGSHRLSKATQHRACLLHFWPDTSGVGFDSRDWS